MTDIRVVGPGYTLRETVFGSVAEAEEWIKKDAVSEDGPVISNFYRIFEVRLVKAIEVRTEPKRDITMFKEVEY